MKSIFKKTFLLVSLAMIASCDISSDDNERVCSYISGVGVSEVRGPNTANVNEEITLDVAFVVQNSCGGFQKFHQTQTGNDIILTVNAIYEGCDCEDTPELIDTTYKFKALSAGVYNLKFKKTNTEFITHTVTVS